MKMGGGTRIGERKAERDAKKGGEAEALMSGGSGFRDGQNDGDVQ